MTDDDYQLLCLYNAESNAIAQALEANGENLDLSQLKMYPSVVPDRDVGDETMDAAVAQLNDLVNSARRPEKKPWWKLW